MFVHVVLSLCVFLCSFSTENFKSSYHSYPFPIPQHIVSLLTERVRESVYTRVHVECESMNNAALSHLIHVSQSQRTIVRCTHTLCMELMW